MNFPNTPFQGGITIVTLQKPAPGTRALQRARLVSIDVAELRDLLPFEPATSDSFSAPASTPTQQVPQAAERH